MRVRARAATVTAALFLVTAATTGTALAEGVAAPPPMQAFVGKGLIHVFNELGMRTKLDVRDIGGGHRTVLWPFNWKVCAQSPAAGAPLAEHIRVSVSVVKKTERCPKR
ncbi:hypothetical protein [Streptomyces sp. WM6378]|uniref:hypothetical protein n=1 Tax=Streptomyces sp. WM6378 TaxID=1415557 RepID=UPI0006AEB586|nr:hypothetical protein [Streptomyces sp. WM6378]